MPGNNEVIIDRGDTRVVYDELPPMPATLQKQLTVLAERAADQKVELQEARDLVEDRKAALAATEKEMRNLRALAYVGEEVTS